ncbi:MAG: hypothetical protein Q8R24_09355 [Legionellaceae bacterium]|nr:hypothetical protein [Legionellaceae bacterium]
MATKTQIDNTKLLGNYIMIVGVGGMVIMSLVGYVALLVLLASDGNTHSHSHGCSGGGNGFTTGFLFAWLLTSNGRYYDHYDALASLIVFALVVSVMTIALACAYGFGTVGMGIAIGWGASLALMALGAATHSYGESLREDYPRAVAGPGQNSVFAQPLMYTATSDAVIPVYLDFGHKLTQ